jgi:hypothetical protein
LGEYPSFAVVAADPLVVVFVFATVGVDLFAEFAVEVVEVILVAVFAEEPVLVFLHA